MKKKHTDQGSPHTFEMEGHRTSNQKESQSKQNSAYIAKYCVDIFIRQDLVDKLWEL